MSLAETAAYIAYKVQSVATAPASQYQEHLSLTELKVQVACLIEQSHRRWTPTALISTGKAAVANQHRSQHQDAEKMAPLSALTLPRAVEHS